MFAVLVLAIYLFCGLVCARVALHDKSPLLRVWLGLSFGMLLFMWLPALAAFLVRFTIAAEMIALGVLLLLTAGAVLWGKKHPHPARRFSEKDRGMLIALLCFALPMTLLSAYLQHTHTLRNVDGTLHVGQSTYGDLAMHLSIVTGLRGSSLPAEYNILPGNTLGYPILTDATGTSMMLLGLPVRWAMIIPGTVMTALVYMGYLLLAREMTGKTSAAVIAGVLLFFNGGLGFLYDFDLSGHDLSKIREIFEGYYKTPANQPDFNLRWSNLVVDLLLPQRTFLGGWVLLLPALYFAREAFMKCERRMFLLVALFGAALPLVHTHSFLTLALYSGGALAYRLVTDKPRRRALLSGAGIYLGIVVVLALPQLLAFTLRQATNEGFLRFHFNWVNNTSAGLVDFYPWFWLKNVGLPLVVMLFALFDWKREDRMDFAGAALIFLVAETILFQPLDYDNNKLFYVWYLLMLPAAANWCVSLWRRLQGRPSRALLAALFLCCSTLSGGLSMAREVISDYQLFSAADAKAAAYIDEHAEPDAMFLTGLHHNNPVYALAGRKVVCGPSLFLHWHGLDYAEREAQVRAFYKEPFEHLELLEEYDVRYIVVGNTERYELEADEFALGVLCETIYDEDSMRIYAVPGPDPAS
ncbi:hypothetical protein LJC74_00665 [Eubacteriales bacterium OttesenSCG-928-A19]|nr:hypothetical protein [Eubacteriales bacterium OttesenSCG-928-A19]